MKPAPVSTSELPSSAGKDVHGNELDSLLLLRISRIRTDRCSCLFYVVKTSLSKIRQKYKGKLHITLSLHIQTSSERGAIALLIHVCM